MATIRSKIIINVITILLTIIGIVGMNYVNLKEMQQMQRIEAKRSQDTVDAKEASMGGMALYQIIADAEIKRDLHKIEKEWAEKKAEVLKNVDLTIKAADSPDEKKLVGEVKVAILEVVSIFEGKMLPALKSSDGITAEIRSLDSQIDAQVNRVESSMDNVVDLMQKKMKRM